MTLSRPRRRRWLVLALLLTGCRSGEDGTGDSEAIPGSAPCTNNDVPSPPDVRQACESDLDAQPPETTQSYRVYLSNSSDDCGALSVQQKNQELATWLLIARRGSVLRATLGTKDDPMAFSGHRLSEALAGQQNGPTMSLTGGLSFSSADTDCAADWRVSLSGQMGGDGFSGTLTHTAELVAGQPGCQVFKGCTTIQVVTAVSTGFPAYVGAGGATQYE